MKKTRKIFNKKDDKGIKTVNGKNPEVKVVDVKAEDIKTVDVEAEIRKKMQWIHADLNSILTGSAEKYFDTVYQNIKQDFMDGKLTLNFFITRCKELHYQEKLEADKFIDASGNIREDVAANYITKDVKEMAAEEEEDKDIPIKFTVVDDEGNRIDPYAAEEEQKKKRDKAVVSQEEAKKAPKPEGLEKICAEIANEIQKNLMNGARVASVAPYPEFDNDKLFQVSVMYAGATIPWIYNVDYKYTIPGKISIVDYNNLIYVPTEEQETIRTLLATNNIDANEVARLNKKYLIPSDVMGVLYHAVEGLGSVNYLKMTEENKKTFTYNLSRAMRIAMDVYDPGSLPRYRIADFKNVNNFKLISDDKVQLSFSGILPFIVDDSRFVIGDGKIEYIDKAGETLFSGNL